MTANVGTNVLRIHPVLRHAVQTGKFLQVPSLAAQHFMVAFAQPRHLMMRLFGMNASHDLNIVFSFSVPVQLNKGCSAYMEPR